MSNEKYIAQVNIADGDSGYVGILAAKIFWALSTNGVDLVGTMTSDHSVACLVREKQLNQAIQVLQHMTE